MIRIGGWRAAAVALAAMLLGAGCQTVESTRLVGMEEETGGTSEERGEIRTYLELVRPLPGYIAADDARRSAWREAPYEEDKRRGFQAFAIPVVYSPSLEEFREDPAQDGVSGAAIEVQLRERQLVTVTKTHQVVSRTRFSGERETRNERVPIYSEWRWEPDCAVVSGQSILVDVVEFLDVEGAFWHWEGTVDEQGRFTIGLAPLLRAQELLGTGSSVTLRVRADNLGSGIEIRIPAQVLFHYAQRQTLFHLAGSADEATPPPPP
jgi:hypothetical protein